MRPRSLAILFALVLALVAFIWLYEKDLPSTEERAELEQRVIPVDRDQIHQVRIEVDGTTVLLAKQVESSEDEEAEMGAADWHLTEPLTARADSDRMEELLRSLEAWRMTRTLEEVAAEEAGFDDPRARVAVTHENGRAEFAVGREIPASSSMLIRLEPSGEIAVVDAGVWSHLERSPDDWRARDVVPVQAADIERVTMVTDSGELMIERREGDRFWIAEPFEDWAGRDQVEDLLADVTGLRAESFIDDPGALEVDLGLAPELRQLVIDVGADEPVRIAVGSESPEQEGQRFVRVGTQVVTARTDLTTALERPIEDWRSLAVTTLETYQIDRLVISARDRDELSLQRAGADWKRNDDVEIPFTTVSDLLYALVDLRASEATAAVGAEAPESGAELLAITLSSDTGRQSLTIYDGLEGEPVRVRVEGRSADLVLGRESYRDVEEKIAAVRTAEALGLEKGFKEVEALPSGDADGD